MASVFFNLFVFIFILIQNYSFSSGNEEGNWKTVFVSLLFRHGDRSPHKFYPNDPYKDGSSWPVGPGQLLNEGKQREYKLGLWLRKRYDELLTNTYRANTVYVQSTDVDRTMMSAECVLAGMYPPKGAQVWNDALDWQPIPVHTPGRKDDWYTGYANCPAYNEELKKVLSSPEIEALNQKYADVYKVLNEHTGQNKSDLKYLFDIYSNLLVEKFANLTLPEWTKTVFPEPLTEAATHSFTLETRTPKLARFKAGLILKSMVDDMLAKTQGNSRNVRVYSGHEHTVATLLNSLGVFELHNPPFGACVMLELRMSPSRGKVVAIYYRNNTISESKPYRLKMPGCARSCPLKQFISITTPLLITPDEWDKECQNTKYSDINK